MKKAIQFISFYLVIVLILTSCSSSTLIQSNPTKAKVYIDGAFVGETPYLHTDSKIVGSSMVVKIEKDGFAPIISTITKDEEVNIGAVVGGLFFAVPFLWTMQYQPLHSYELKPISSLSIDTYDLQKKQINTKSKVDKLRELKQLLDEKIINQDEFEKEKEKVLDSND